MLRNVVIANQNVSTTAEVNKHCVCGGKCTAAQEKEKKTQTTGSVS